MVIDSKTLMIEYLDLNGDFLHQTYKVKIQAAALGSHGWNLTSNSNRFVSPKRFANRQNGQKSESSNRQNVLQNVLGHFPKRFGPQIVFRWGAKRFAKTICRGALRGAHAPTFPPLRRARPSLWVPQALPSREAARDALRARWGGGGSWALLCPVFTVSESARQEFPVA